MGERTIERSVLQGTVNRIVYQDPNGRYTVARLDIDRSQEVTVVGPIFPLGVGEEIRVSGTWRMHPRYGLEFQVEAWEKIEPATLGGIERYLGSGLIQGIGPVYARRLVSAFGLDTLRILSEEPHRLLEVPGIGELRARRILSAWDGQKGMRDVMIFLQGHGLSPAFALRVYRAFGQEAVARVKENPYCLAREIYGIGFHQADRIAASLGIKDDSPLRVQAGLLHVLAQLASEGHCFIPQPRLVRETAGLLRCAEPGILSALDQLSSAGEVSLENGAGEPRVYLREIHDAELRVAAAIRRLLSHPSCLADKRLKVSGLDSANPLDLFNRSTFSLNEEQEEAVRAALFRKILLITGGPGTGKTTLLRALLILLRRARASFVLAAPTGRAAKRMGEMAGEEAKTIHRLLEYNPRERRFSRCEENPLDADVVIIDEASMVDLSLMDHLLRAVEPRSHLVLLGDVDQLPSVGPGSVLRDLIDSESVPVVVLRSIFRQERESLIVANAHRILEGKPLVLGAGGEGDFVFIHLENDVEVLDKVKELVSQILPRRLGIAAEAIQVLTPMHRGSLGTVHLNRELQRLLNSEAGALELGEKLFRVGDKVMQLRNNYDKGVFNGDLGRIVRIEDEEIQVDFDGREVSYGPDEVDELSLAYAISIHKSQGSEYPVVVIPLHMSHYLMLHRSVLYTGVTRGRKLVVLVGSRKAVWLAIKNVRLERRLTGLKEKLRTGG